MYILNSILIYIYIYIYIYICLHRHVPFRRKKMPKKPLLRPSPCPRRY
jgi:hypothetical protein